MSKRIPKEIKLSKVKPIVSRTDLRGKIQYINPYFSEVSGYSESELIDAPHNIIRHHDMPKVIFKLMWQRLKSSQNILALVKNMAKNGDYYWVVTSFEIKYSSYNQAPEAYLALRKSAPRDAINKIIPLYNKLLAIEEEGGIEASEEYLVNLLREKNMTYDEFMIDLVKYRGLMVKFFEGMRRLFY